MDVWVFALLGAMRKNTHKTPWEASIHTARSFLVDVEGRIPGFLLLDCPHFLINILPEEIRYEVDPWNEFDVLDLVRCERTIDRCGDGAEEEDLGVELVHMAMERVMA